LGISILAQGILNQGEAMNSVDVGIMKSIKVLPKIEIKNALLQKLLFF
jgi:hypothetical protein